MAANSNIEWTHHTFNPWIGCTKVSPACEHCYAEVSTASRALGVTWGAGQERRRTTDANWQNPIKWNAEAERLGVRYRVFCASLADVFDNDVPTSWRMDLFSLIAKTPNLDWLLLTKRIGNVLPLCSGDSLMLDQLAKVWLGITVCNQQEADRDIPKLLQVPAKVRFLSIEPMLDAIDLTHINKDKEQWEINTLKPYTWEEEIENWRGTSDEWQEDLIDWYNLSEMPSGPMHQTLDWVIVGGESGNNARPMHPDWARGVRNQCAAARVPFLFKQWGEWRPYCTHEQMIANGYSLPTHHHYLGISPNGITGHEIQDTTGMHWMGKVGKKSAGRMLDGVTHDEYPEVKNG